MMKKNNAIVYMTNRKYDFLLGVCLVNLKTTNQKNYDKIIVYHDCFTDEEIAKFKIIEPKVEFRFYSLEDFYKENELIENPQTKKYLQRFSHFTPVRIRKCLELLREYKSVLYLDLDTLIVDDNCISELSSVRGVLISSPGNKDQFTTSIQKGYIENFEEKYPNFLNNIDKKLATWIAHPNLGVLYVEESLPYEDIILECKKWLKSHWMDKKEPVDWLYDELMLPYLLLKFKIKPYKITGFNVRLTGSAIYDNPKILHNYSPEYNKKLWNNKYLLPIFSQWQDYYMEAKQITGIKMPDESSLITEPFYREKIIYESVRKDRWINILQYFKIPKELKITKDFTRNYLPLFTDDSRVYYELKYDYYNPYSQDNHYYAQLIIKHNNNDIYLQLKKYQEIIPNIIISVDRGGWIIAKTKSVKKEQIQSLFDALFIQTFPIIFTNKLL